MSDLISRQAAIDEIKALYEWHDTVTEDRAVDHIKRLPSVGLRMRGIWNHGICSKCGGNAPFWPMASTYHESNFCPDCGADMREEEQDE